MSAHSPTDVLVVGAGPAGAWAATCLARQGARVRLFDHSHPREKPCGGGLTGRAVQLVADAFQGRTLPQVAIARGVFEDSRTAPSVVELDRRHAHVDTSLVVVSRRAFDGALLEFARESGVEHHPDRVTDVAIEGGRARVSTRTRTYDADWVIGADGANSLVRRRLHRAFRRDQISLTAGVFAHDRTDRSIIVRFVSDPPGYIWSFPRTDHLAIGICAQADEAGAAETRAVLETWLTQYGLTEGARLERYGWPIPSLSAHGLAAESPAGPGFLLAGDAAGLVDPITREGIYFALLSGQYAADALGAPQAAERYVARLHAQVYPELAHAARLKRGFFRGPFTRLLVDALRHSEPVRQVMVDLVAGTQPYATLKRRLMRTLEWRLAWQLLRLEFEGLWLAQRAR